MKTYHFTIVVRDATIDMEGLEDRLYEAGCDDALICSYNQTVYLEFDRKAKSASHALQTALSNIHSAGFNDLVVQEGGLSTLSEMADRAQLSRAVLSLYAKNKRGDGHFPPPIYGVSSGSALYSWPEVAAWLHAQGKIEETQYEVARAAMA